ncbi:hypothetical protein U9M48_030730, partial [Paspalum notatum var. saurae]
MTTHPFLVRKWTWKKKIRQLVVQAAALITALYAFLLSRLRMQERSRPVLAYGPLSKMDEQRQHNLNLIYNCNAVECVNMLRMRRAPFFSLCNLLRERNLLRDNLHCCVEEQVAMFLHIVGHNQRFRVIHPNWRRSIETVSRHFKEVLYAIGELREDMIRAPSSETPLKIMNGSWYPYFKDCVGAIDGTHIYARVPQKMQAAFRRRKHYTTQNVLAAVDFDLEFTYVLAGWEGSAHDATILADALERSDGLRVEQVQPSRRWICMSHWLPPHHLKEYGGRNYPTNPRELFNLRHSSLRVTVKRAFGALKNRFRILDNKPFHPLDTRHGVDEVIPLEASWVPNVNVPHSYGIAMDDNAAWAHIRDEWANSMWANRVRTDKGFKEVHLNQVAKALQEFSGQDVTGTQVHPKDAEYLNKPIENYQQMEVIFGNGLATSKFAMGSIEALGNPSDFVESAKKIDFNDDVKEMFSPDDVGPKNETGGADTKRMRSFLTEDDCILGAKLESTPLGRLLMLK